MTLADLPDAHAPVVQRLASTRLVVIGENGDGEPAVRLAHDALLTRWGRLRQWIEEDRDFRGWQLKITSQRLRWQENGDSGALLRGGALTVGGRAG